MSSALHPRVIDGIAGTVNLRDFGGYPTEAAGRVREGLLFRSGRTHQLDAQGVAALAVRTGIRTVIDLRSASERSGGLSAFEQHGIQMVHENLGTGFDPATPAREKLLAMASGSFDWAELYWDLATRNQAGLVRIFGLLASPGALPVLIHCQGGRDRTGVTVALILGALGVAEDDIATDYALSSELLRRSLAAADHERLFEGIGIPMDEVQRALATVPETMHAFFARIRMTHGSVPGYLRAIGVSAAVLGDLQAALVEPDADGSG